MKKIYLSLLATLSTIASYAQTSNLVVFSDEGKKFYLVINGRQVNDQSLSNVRVTDLDGDYVHARVVFEDKRDPSVEKKILLLSQGNEVTYVLKKNKKGETVFRSYSEVPLSMVPAQIANQPTLSYSTAASNDESVNKSEYSTTSTTTTTTGATGILGANVNIGGVNMNVTIQDNGTMLNGSSTTTTSTYSTTTTNTNANTNTQYNNSNNENTNYSNDCVNGMSETELREAKKSISSSTFADTMENTFKQIVSNKCVTTKQVKQMLQLFTFEESKLDMAKYAYGYVADPANYYSVNDIFTHSSSKDELSEYCMENKR